MLKPYHGSMHFLEKKRKKKVQIKKEITSAIWSVCSSEVRLSRLKFDGA